MEAPVAPKRISTPKPQVAATRSVTVTESRYKDGKLKEREVVRKSEYKNGKLIKHQSVERAIVDTAEKIQ